MLVSPEGGELVTSVVGDHSSLARGPLSGANLTVLISELEGLDESEGLLDVSANGEIVDGELSESSLLVDDVSSSVSNTGILTVFNKAAVVTGNLFGQVRHHGDVHGSESTGLTVLLGVLSVGEVRVDGDTNNLGTNFLELLSLVGELADFGGAHEGEVKGPEEENNVLV